MIGNLLNTYAMKVEISKMVIFLVPSIYDFALPFDRFDDPRVYDLFSLFWLFFDPHNLDDQMSKAISKSEYAFQFIVA